MSIFVLIALAMIIMILMLRRRLPVGLAVLAAGAVLWLGTGGQPMKLVDAFQQMLLLPRNYNLIGALYLIICLEIILRKSGILAGMVRALHRMFASAKFTVAAMPAFLGLLPSIGGARFSAPIVEQASVGLVVSPERKAAINYWFRHVNEYCCPMMTAMILTSGITGASMGDLILHLGWVSVSCFLIGWLILMTPIKQGAKQSGEEEEGDPHHDRVDFVLALIPVTISVTLMVTTTLPAPVSMFAAVVALIILAKLFGRWANVADIFLGALDKKMFFNVTCILFFIQVLAVTGTLDAIVDGVQALGLPVPIVVALIAFLVGMLTGQSQGHISMVMPIVAALTGADLQLIGIGYVFGMAGEMITPAHLCMVISVDYFKSDFVRFWWQIFAIQMIVLAIFAVWTYVMWI